MHATALACAGENRCLCCYLHYRLCQLLHLHLNDKVLEMSLSTVILLLNDQLTLWLSIALNLSLKFIEAINYISLHAIHLLLQLSDHRVHTFLRRQIYLAITNLESL